MHCGAAGLSVESGENTRQSPCTRDGSLGSNSMEENVDELEGCSADQGDEA